jgi:hypothetical protein
VPTAVKLQSVTLYDTTAWPESVFPQFDYCTDTATLLVVFDGRNIPFTKTNKGVQDWLIAAGYDKDGDGKISYYEASLADSLSGRRDQRHGCPLRQWIQILV